MGPSWRSIATLFAMMFASQLALTIYLPAVPEMALDLGVSASHVQLIIPSYLGAFALMQLVAGPLSDAFGRRPVILSGLVLFFFASIIRLWRLFNFSLISPFRRLFYSSK